MDNLAADHYACGQSGSCGLAGAAAFFAGIDDAGVIVNGQLWCYFYAQRRVERQYPAAAERMACTYIDGTAIVYGTEEQLGTALRQLKERRQPAVVAIINSCAVSLIGDDTVGIAERAGLECPVICVDANGLQGGFAEGYRLAAKAYFSRMALTGGLAVKSLSVNLLGCTAGYYNAGPDLAELQRLLKLSGCSVNAAVGAGGTVQTLTRLRQAELNVVLYRELGEELAKYLYTEYHIPYIILAPPYGVEGTLRWAEELAGCLTAGPSAGQALRQEAAGLAGELHRNLLNVQRLWGNLWFDHIVVAGPSSVALAVAQAVRYELADTRRLAVILEEGADRVALQGIDAILTGTADSAVRSELICLQGGLLLGSSNETARLRQLGVTKVARQNIALPVLDEVIITPRPFLGLNGMRYLSEQLWNQFIRLQELLDGYN